MRFATCLPLAVLALQVTAPPIAAQSPPGPAAAANPHEAIYLTMLAGTDPEQQLSTLTTTMAQQFATASPELIEGEAKYPGMARAMAQAIRPVLRSYTNRLREAYQPRFIAVLAQTFTVAEARDIAMFYASPLGRKVLGGVSDSYDGKAAVASAINGGEVTADAVATDQRVAVRRTLARLTPADTAELEALARRQPALLKLGTLGTRMAPLRLEMENAPLLPAEESAIESAVTGAIKKHIENASHAK